MSARLRGNKDFDRKAREELRKYAKVSSTTNVVTLCALVVRRVLVARPAERSRIFNRRNLGSLPVNYKA